MWAGIKVFFAHYESRIVLVLGFILIAFISFEAGMIKGKQYAEKSVIIQNCPSSQEAKETTNETTPETQNMTQDNQNITETNAPSQNCSFIGSKNSDKYHMSSCRWAKQIKPENQVCFSSENDAKSKGYQADKNCIK